jgi:hypothetical protein
MSHRLLSFRAATLAVAAFGIGAQPVSGATTPEDYSYLACPVLSHIGVALVSFRRAAPDDYAMSLSVPRNMAGYFLAYVFDVRDGDHKLLAAVPAGNATALPDEGSLAIRSFRFHGEPTDSTGISVIETYPYGKCTFANPEIGRATIGESLDQTRAPQSA